MRTDPSIRGLCTQRVAQEKLGVGDSVVRPVHRVQLFFPPMVFSRLQSRQTAMFPLGLGYVAAAMESSGYEVSLIDCASEGYDTTVSIGKDREVYGLTPEQIGERIRQCRPDAIGISCLFSTLEKRMLMIARIAKEIDPGIVVVCGGPHVSAFYSRIIAAPAVDYCVIGEGEKVTVDLFEALNSNGKGLENIQALCYRRNGEAVIQPRRDWIKNLDEVPFPARHLVDNESYHRIGKVQGLRTDGQRQLRIEQMTTSRGCPFQCTYCGKGVTWGKKFRTRSVENVLDEIEHLIERYGIERLAFQDDNLTADMQRAEQIFDGIVERKFNITWEAHNGLGVNFLNPELLKKMKASGCTSFTIAVESANETILRRVNKPNFTKLAPPIVNKARELGIEVRGFFMIGFPGETADEVKITVEYARSLDLSISAFALVTPLPGTKLYQQCVEAGMIDQSTVDFEDFSFGGFDVQLSEVPVEELKMIRKVEWLKTVLMDPKSGHLKAKVDMNPEEVLEELQNGLRLFPQEEVLKRLYSQAVTTFGGRAEASV